ncbi:MAG: sigma factor-like helix-turn-helix DNA-binding protein [Candidatus Poribacteria bacterium]
MQEAWIVVVQRLPTLRDPARFPGWLYRIVVRCATRRRQTGASYRAAIDRLMAATPHDGRARAGSEDEPPQVAGALHALSPKDSLVVGLHYFGGIAVKEIARVLDLPLGTVKSRLYHARQTLRRELKRMSDSADTHTPREFRKVIAGNLGEMPWQSMFDGSLAGWRSPTRGEPPKPLTGIPDGWEAVGDDGLVGENYGHGTTLKFGDLSWRDIEVSALVTPIHGGNTQVSFRMDDDRNGYVFDLMLGWQVAAIHRITRMDDGSVDLVKLSTVNYPVERGREYAVGIAARGHSITSYVDGAVVNQLTDDTWQSGRVGLEVWQSKTLYRSMRYRVLDEN